MLNAQATEYSSPEFTLEVAITGVGADIRLNDISVEFETFKGHSTMTYDVNQSIVPGINELKIITFPFFDQTPPNNQTKKYHPEAEVKVSLYANEKNNSTHKTLLSQIHLIPAAPLDQAAKSSAIVASLDPVLLDDKNQSLSYPNFNINQQITATRKSLPVQSNYPRWDWLDGETIKNTQENYDSLLAVYRDIYEAYKSGNRNQLFALQNDTAKEISLAYSLAGGITEGHTFIETAELLDNPNVELYDFFTDGVKLDIFANGKLARIVDITQHHPVLYIHKTLDLVYKLKFAFYKNQQNKWVMIR